MSKVVLITGCSTGIGRDLVQHLAQVGYQVVATARKRETLAALPAALKLPLDVTRPQSIQEAVAHTLQQLGRIDVLVNNAGYGSYGAVEEIPEGEARQIFEVNMFGLLGMVRAVAPAMRQQGAGRILNLSALVGRLSFPVNGAYAASKFAVEALSDALRLEMAPLGIQVILIEPGPTRTPYSMRSPSPEILSNPASPYRTLYENFRQLGARMHAHGADPRVVSRVIQRAIEARRPKARYPAAIDFSGQLAMALGPAVWDRVLRRMLKIAA